MLEDIGVEDSEVHTELALLLRNSRPRALGDRQEALGCGIAVASRGRGKHPGLEGRRQLGPEGPGSIMQINANEHLPGAGTAWAWAAVASCWSSGGDAKGGFCAKCGQST